jgi:hypothetical protein
MPKFSNGKITTSSILYNRGVPPSDQRFVYIASMNYSMLKQNIIYNRRQGRPVHSLFPNLTK